jgi:hypothetical protein
MASGPEQFIDKYADFETGVENVKNRMDWRFSECHTKGRWPGCDD